MLKNIAILTGGPGYEREIALKSSKLFEKYININFKTFIFPEELDLFLHQRSEFDGVIPVFHGEWGEDGKIFAMLDILGMKYPFSSCEVHSFCLNKFLSNNLLSGMGIHTGKQFLIDEGEQMKYSPKQILENNSKRIADIGYPFIMKPTHGGSSFYTYKIHDEGEFLEKSLECFGTIADSFLIQEFILGEEYSVSIVGGKALPHIMKVQKEKSEIFNYANKYEEDIERFPELEQGLRNNLSSQAEKIFSTLWCRTVSRVDFIVRDSVPYFLEINTIPGMTEVSILPKAWKLSGKSLDEFVEFIVSEIK
ncbi:ATP-grasp domain-containing protein [Candidatus Gracilibacteria bacterium]|nr:ATP-grasp domain-containing protein [Candidatus Gracilibacteria bacterium]